MHVTGTDARVRDGSGRPDCLLDRARIGDRDAVRELYMTYAARVRRCADRILDDPHDAEDVAQDVFVKLLTRMDRYESREAPFGAWLMRVAHNEAIDHRRRRRSVPCADVEEHQARCSAPRATELIGALTALPSDQREVVVLRHVGGYSPVEIADRLGRTPASIHGLQHRGAAALRLGLADLDYAA